MVTAAPISQGERRRFSEELKRNVKELRKSEINDVGIAFDPNKVEAIKKRLRSLGWTKQSKSFVGFELVRADWTWPIFIDLKQNLIYLGPDDGAASAKEYIAEAAKAILPGGFGVFDSYAVYKNPKADPSVLDQILAKAKAKGFKFDKEWRKGPLVLHINFEGPSLTVYILFDAKRGV